MNKIQVVLAQSTDRNYSGVLCRAKLIDKNCSARHSWGYENMLGDEGIFYCVMHFYWDVIDKVIGEGNSLLKEEKPSDFQLEFLNGGVHPHIMWHEHPLQQRKEYEAISENLFKKLTSLIASLHSRRMRHMEKKW